MPFHVTNKNPARFADLSGVNSMSSKESSYGHSAISDPASQA